MKNNVSLLQIAQYFLRIGTTGFGGSIALAHTMHADLVQKRKWISNDEYLRGLTMSQLAPGPLSAQLAIYIGYLLHKKLGATIAGTAFILPSFFLVLTLGIIYVRFGTLPIIAAILYGIGAAVIGIIVSSGYAITKVTMKKKLLLWLIYCAVFSITVFSHATNIFVFIASGVVTMVFYTREKITEPKKVIESATFFPLVSLLSPKINAIPNLFFFFLSAGTIAFGGGLSILPYLQEGVVSQFHWLTNKQFVDAVAIAMVTPGPVVIASTFIGYLAGGILGSLIATTAIFLPVYLIVIFLTPLFTKHADHPHVIAFIEGVTAAAMGSIAASVILLGQQAIKDIPTLVIALVALVAVRFLKIPGIVIVILSGIIGILILHTYVLP